MAESKRIKAPEGVEIRHWASGKTTIRIRFTCQGRLCRESLKLSATKKNLQYAAHLRGEILNAIAYGTFDYSKYFPNSKQARHFGHEHSSCTVAELIDNYLNARRVSLRQSTHLGYVRKVERHVKPHLGHIPIKKLTPAMLREWISTLRLSYKTIKDVILPLKAALSMAICDQMITLNPFDQIEVKQWVHQDAHESDYEVDPFDRDEVNAILNTAESLERNFFQFCFFTGLRSSEVIALKWEDIDWVHSQVKIKRTRVNNIEEEKTKTKGSKREVMLLSPALEALKRQKSYTFLEGQYIFHDRLTKQPFIGPYQIAARWRALLKKAGVCYRNPYQMRHTYASSLLSQGENMLWVSKQMGHKTTEMVMRTYGKWIPDRSTLTGYTPKADWGSYLEKHT